MNYEKTLEETLANTQEILRMLKLELGTVKIPQKKEENREAMLKRLEKARAARKSNKSTSGQAH